MRRCQPSYGPRHHKIDGGRPPHHATGAKHRWRCPAHPLLVSEALGGRRPVYFPLGRNFNAAVKRARQIEFTLRELKIVPEVFRRVRPTKSVTMAKASLNNGQEIYAVNDLFIGPKTHGSARYTIRFGGKSERHSSSGVIVSTGLGSTGWLSSLIAGAQGVAATLNSKFTITAADGQSNRPLNNEANAQRPQKLRFPWDADHLFFTVREPFPSNTTGADLVFGKVSKDSPLNIESHMPERGVIFSDGIEADFLEFNSGAKVAIGVADRKGLLVV
jgi:hypothetical protein